MQNTPTADGYNTTPMSIQDYDTQQSDAVHVMRELCGMWSTIALQSLPGPLWSRLVAHNSILSMGRIGLNYGFEGLLLLHLNCIFMINWIV